MRRVVALTAVGFAFSVALVLAQGQTGAQQSAGSGDWTRFIATIATTALVVVGGIVILERRLARLETSVSNLTPKDTFAERIGEIRTQIVQETSNFRTDFKEEITNLRTDFKAEIGNLRSDFTKEVTNLRTDLKQEVSRESNELKIAIAQVGSDIKELRHQHA